MASLAACLAGVLGLLGQTVTAVHISNSSSSSATVHWLGSKPEVNLGATFGLPWPRGKYFPEQTTFSASDSDGQSLDLQSWATGYWPDGSFKWTGHAIPASDTVPDTYTVKATSGSSASSSSSHPRKSTPGITVSETPQQIKVDTGKIAVSFPKSGDVVIAAIETAAGKTVGKNGRLVLQSQDAVYDTPDARGKTPINYFHFQSRVSNVTVSDPTSVRALVTVRGTHSPLDGSSHAAWLPFVLRFYLYANSHAIRLVHSIVFDGNATSNFVSGLGVRLDVPLQGEAQYNRHVRLAGVDGGLLSEAVQGITGLRRDPGQAVRTAQVEGRELPDISTWDARVSSRLRWIPTWADYSLSQLSPDGFTLRKRTKTGQSWLTIPGGTRADGLAYLGGATVGGVAVGLRDFWKRYPTGIDIANASSDDTGTITLWLYSPQAPPLDLRPYHDGLGEDTYAEQLDALDITYEDYEPGFDTPYGIARTSEISFFAFDSTPSRETLSSLAGGYLHNPPVLVASPGYIRSSAALGTYWDLPLSSSNSNTTTTGRAHTKIEAHLSLLATFYQTQTAQRRWYGFLDYGDIMHTYDADRHTWRYDVGGYAWDNSELSPDLFFWLYFLRTGREDIYRFAEALTRHTAEVDVYHLGKWKGLGTRHGVQHWSDSAKQARISQPQYRKYFYYLSGGDERVGELLEEALDTDVTYGVLDPNRKVRTDGWTPAPGRAVAIGLGTDWSALAAGWLMDWERRGERWRGSRTKLVKTMAGIARLKNGFVTGSGLYNLSDWTLGPPPADPGNEGTVVAVSHLSAVFGLVEVVAELIDWFGDSEEEELPAGFKDAWLEYCYYFNAGKAEQKARYGVDFGNLNLYQGHSRLTAYVARERGDDEALRQRAWKEFYTTDGLKESAPWNVTTIDGKGQTVLGEGGVEEASWFATNDVAQYGLAAIENLALVGGALAGYTG
ncbi:uncharacterized protein B0T15DRAFT_535651 [Chaetomium strumarium]|uniref:Tat pathway signal sequence domain protein n=1 Tax=Chaetomium strumarium TaxID=1170767 RepID=A0AAJ0GQ98_9PEZI|nr:hypothetical protein B0T15DRAFT_535651 [Chaetomium strumarium]